MFNKYKNLRIPDKAVVVIVYLVIALGIFLRLAVYLQNRNLFIDEANVARNIFERGFSELTLPLNYEQYAPPLFLWGIKVATILFGYSEYAYRLLPLLAGIASLFLFVAIMRRLNAFRASWYPLLLLATGFIYIQYATELKQYMVDVCVSLALILWALKTNILEVVSYRFIMFWIVIGSIAIWLSMPSIFTLIGVGGYYLAICIKQKKYTGIWHLVPVGIVWLAQFAFYYFTILKPQANSEYLQRYHHDYFLVLLHAGKAEWAHNVGLVTDLFDIASGSSFLPFVFNIGLLLYAIVLLIRNNIEKAILLVVPVLCVFLAASINQFSLIPRVVLFIMPLFLLLIGYGFNKLLSVRFTAVKVIAIAIAVIGIKNYNRIDLVWHPYTMEQVKEELAFLKKHDLAGSQVYVENNVRPAFIYYTQVHPGKQQWAKMKDAHLLYWDVKFDSLAASLPPGKAGFMFTSMGREQLDHYRGILSQYMTETDKLEAEYRRCFVYIYIKKNAN